LKCDEKASKIIRQRKANKELIMQLASAQNSNLYLQKYSTLKKESYDEITKLKNTINELIGKLNFKQ
jgi:hypothetical protein